MLAPADNMEIPYSFVSEMELSGNCLLYTSDAADERSSVDLGGRRIIKKKKKDTHHVSTRSMRQAMGEIEAC